MLTLVTGASSGIGKEISIYLSELGYDLILVARDNDKLKEVQKEIKTNCEIISLDLTKKDNVFKLYDLCKDKKIDVLVNNAGFGLFGLFTETDLDKELEMIDLNIVSYHILTKLFLKDFVKRDQGYILNVCSSAGFLAGPRLNTYYATKNYVTKLTMAINEELRQTKSNVHISALCPGPVNTNFNNVANGDFTIKGASPKYVAKYAIDHLFKNKMIIIPGFSIKLAVFSRRILSNRLMLKITYRIQYSKENKKSN